MARSNFQLVPLSAVPLVAVSQALAKAFAEERHGVDEWLLMLQHEVRAARIDMEHSVVAIGPRGVVGACVANAPFGAVGRVGPTGVIGSHRRQGVARDMVTRVVQALEAEGAQRCVLEVATTNTSAQRLYQSLGFAPGRTLQTLEASRADLRPPARARTRRIEPGPALAAAGNLHPERPVFQRSAPFLASYRDGVIAHAIDGAGEHGVVLQRGRAVLDLACPPDDDLVSALALAAADVSWHLRLIHVTDDDPLRPALHRVGFHVESEALEMVRVPADA